MTSCVHDQCYEHNFDNYVDFMFAKLTTMTLYLEVPRLFEIYWMLKRRLWSYYGFEIFINVPYHNGQWPRVSNMLHKSWPRTWGFKLRFYVFDVATFVFGWAKQGRRIWPYLRTKSHWGGRGNLQESQEASGYPEPSQWHRCFPNVLPPSSLICQACKWIEFTLVPNGKCQKSFCILKAACASHRICKMMIS